MFGRVGNARPTPSGRHSADPGATGPCGFVAILPRRFTIWTAVDARNARNPDAFRYFPGWQHGGAIATLRALVSPAGPAGESSRGKLELEKNQTRTRSRRCTGSRLEPLWPDRTSSDAAMRSERRLAFSLARRADLRSQNGAWAGRPTAMAPGKDGGEKDR